MTSLRFKAVILLNKYYKAFFAILILSLFAVGCATEMPSTEGLVFKGMSGQNQRENQSNKLTVGISDGFTWIIHSGSFRRAAAREYGESKHKNGKSEQINQLAPSYLLGLPIPSVFVSYKNRLALGSNLPVPVFWQIDGTVRLFRQYYLTLSKKIFEPNTQIILERRMLYRNHGGIALGAFYRYDLFKFVKLEGLFPFPFPVDSFKLSWFGLRTFFQLSGFQGKGFHYQGIVSVGYVPELNVPLFVVGISFNFRFGGYHHHESSNFPGTLF